MDVSKIVWALAIVALIGLVWLVTNPGINYLYKQYTSGTPGQDAAADERAEAGLSRMGGFLLATFRYEKALQCYNAATERYPNGKNYWWNVYQSARCYERLERYADSARVLQRLIAANADTQDERVPDNDTLNLRLQKLIEVHELQVR
jgi:tetratricopeptide (TPR) repeat protein